MNRVIIGLISMFAGAIIVYKNDNIIIKGLTDENNRETKDYTASELERIRQLSPFKIKIERENYIQEKETLIIESVEDRNNEDLPTSYFTLQVQSMSESDSYWLDSGVFANLSISHN